MALLNHSDNKGTSKKLLTRGPKIEVNNKVNRTDIEKDIIAKKTKSKENIVLSNSVTEPVNVRVDNHIRNKLSALITLGHYDSQKEIVEALVNNYIDGLEKSEFKRFEDLVQIYESKDVKKHQKKKAF